MAAPVETVRHVYELLATGDVERVGELIAEDAELDLSGLYPDGPVLHGPAEIVNFQKHTPWQATGFEVESIEQPAPGRVLVRARTRVRATTSGIDVEMRVSHAYTVRDGLIRRIEVRSEDAPARLSHLDEAGAARMVDVGAKPATDRRALARAVVRMAPATAAAVAAGDAPKGDVVSTARIAGIQAAKRTAELIPLCHPLPLSFVDVRIEVGEAQVHIEAEARTNAPTGVEMEALTACSVAALTVYDMVKGIERGVRVTDLRLVEKAGGKEDWCEPQS